MTRHNGYPASDSVQQAPTVDPEALASPEDIRRSYENLNQLIDRAAEADPNFAWSVTHKFGAGDSAGDAPQPHLRLMSLPVRIENGKKLGESFVRVSWSDGPSGRQILVTEDAGSGNPLGDVMGSLSAGAIVKKIDRTDTAFLSSEIAEVRLGNFTFGPAQLERLENARQVINPFSPANNRQIARIRQVVEQRSIYAHDGKGNTPPDEELKTLRISDIIQ